MFNFRSRSLAFVWTLLAISCGGATVAAPPRNESANVVPHSATGPEAAPPPVSPPPTKAMLPPPVAEIFARVSSDFRACYEHGKKAAPRMSDGKVTWLASVEPSGKTTCVVPNEDSGLTQEVEDCMSARLARETYAPGTNGSFEMPLFARDGAIELRTDVPVPLMGMVEEHGLPDAGYVVTSLLPEFKACVQPLATSSSLRVVHIGGRVESDGRVACALASSVAPIPPSVRDCSASVLKRAKFAPPKSGAGTVSIPLKILRGKQ